MNNAVFDKIMENVRNHVDVKLIIKWDERRQWSRNRIFTAAVCFCEKFIRRRSAQIRGEVRQADLRGYVHTILDISKVCLYEFHHEYMSSMYRKCKVMYTDTGSLIYHIECDDVYENMKHDIARFDTSDYPADNV